MSQIQKICDQLLKQFEAAGAERITADILQPADVLLDLYGEDIRGRAYVTHDPLRGELMMRPDFTVPVVQRHMSERAEPARYCYAGPVFRQQDFAATRPSEHLQVGYEVFDRGDAATIEAEVFTLFKTAIDPIDPRAMVGDVGLLIAAVDILDTSDARKAALKRHIWRPARFAQLLERFSNPAIVMDAGVSGPQIGIRTAQDVALRWEQLRHEAQIKPIPHEQVQGIKQLLDIRALLVFVPDILFNILKYLPDLAPAVDRFCARFTAFEKAGLHAEDIEFYGTYGLEAMEYYDGFVFGFYGDDDTQPAIATGGRYDALTKVLGQGRDVPAVGGVIRPELLVGMMP